MGRHAAAVPKVSPRRKFAKVAHSVSFVSCAVVALLVGGASVPNVSAFLDPASARVGASSEPDKSASKGDIKSDTSQDRGLGEASVSRETERVAEITEAAPVESPQPLIPKSYLPAKPDSLEKISFRVASYNVLGYDHSREGGNKPGYADGRDRMRWAMDLLNSHDVTVAGLQEFQMEQYQTFASYTGGSWGAYPGGSLGRGPVQNNVVWKKSVWTFVDGGTLPIPYFGGKPMLMPHVLLEHNASGRRVWFSSYHNPADVRGPAGGYRARATAMEANNANAKMAETGDPFVVTGDMNDKSEFICPFTAMAPSMHSADGAYTDGSGCHIPNPPNIDWIVGSGSIEWSNYVEERGSVGRISDHPLIVATGIIGPLYNAKKCVKDADGKEFCPLLQP
jgi:hypothetical protein